VLHIYMTLVA